MRLDSRVAVITGAGRGIGAAAALRFAEAGAAVAACDLDGGAAERTAERVARVTGRPTCAVQVDVREPVAVSRMITEVTDRLGPVEILVNNAGILRNAPLGEMSDEDWSTVVDVSLKGTFVCSRAVRPMMVERGYGKIINVSSGAALGSSRGHANYSAAKAGIIGLTRTLALELGPWNINVNAVAPGAVDTEMARATAEQLGIPFEEYRRQVERTVPLRRLARPEEVADVMCFLASEAARHVSGEVVFVTGGPPGR